MTSERQKALLNTQSLFLELLQIIKPPPNMSLSEWAEQNRVISGEESAAPGPWRNDVLPFAVDVMDAISDQSIREVVLMWGVQIGKTNIILNAIGYHMDHDPCPLMVVQPTVAMGETFSGKRLTPMLRDTPCLRDKVPPEKSRTTGNTILEKSFPGGYIVIAGGNSAASLKSRPIRNAYCDEVDEYPQDVEGQGDPLDLIRARQTRFPNRKTVIVSTPTIKGRSHIENAYNNSSKERWNHCCPGCGEWSAFSWRRLRFDSLEMACPFCGELNPRRAWLKNGGKWIAENPDSKVRGFHITALDAPMPSWAELVDEWVEAERLSKTGNHAKLKTFINTRLAETWEPMGERIEGHALEKRREVYNAEVPDGVCVLTMGVDVQDTRLAYEVVGWGLGFESWGIEYGEIWGDPRQGEVWQRLDEILANTWSYANGVRLRISRAAVDTGGHMTTQVYTYCKAREVRGVYAVKGQAGDRIPMTRPGKTNKSLFMVGVDGIKADIYSWLRVGKPGEGYSHFPMCADRDAITQKNLPERGYDSDFFNMLTSEKRVSTQNKKGYTVYAWEKPSGARNEALDCRVYARAALRIMANRDDIMLKRLYAKQQWAGEMAQYSTIDGHGAAAPARPAKRKVSRNNRNAQSGVTL